MARPKPIVFVLCFCCAIQVYAQKDTVHVLRSVEVTQSRLGDHILAAYELPIDSSLLSVASNGSLTDLLRKQGLGHIRSYGPGGLATPSFRGTGSSHTTVLWNGINLVSPLSGQLDLSLVPAGLFESASIQTGGSASVAGNGSIGANIHLNNNLNFNEGLRTRVSAYAGSFATQYYDAALQLSNANVGSSTKVFYASSDNDFKFTNTSVFPPAVQRRQHSGQLQYGLLQQVHVRAQEAGVFSAKLWYQKTRYEIPNATTILRPSEATEDNEFYRVLAGWNYASGNFELNYQGAFIRQDLDYADAVIGQRSFNRYNSTIQNIELNLDLKNQTQLTSGLNYTWEQGIVQDFGEIRPVRNRIALFAAYKVSTLRNWGMALSGRAEIVDGNVAPFAPTVSARYQINRAIDVFSNLSRNYRLPTFNDLYWKGAGAVGNPALTSETSLNAEVGARFARPVVSAKVVVFSNNVDNWIQWSPQNGQTWTPQNIKKVWCRGIESQLSLNRKTALINSKFTIQYSFTRSTNESIYANGNPNEKSKQLVLTPLHEGSATGELSWKKYSLRIVSAYTGEQFNDSDNSPYNVVDDYLITNVWIGKSLDLKGLALTFSGEVNNLFNVSYQARPGYPLPGINYKFGIQINFNKTNHES